MPWKVERIDTHPIETIRADCTCADHCKEAARKDKKQAGDDAMYKIIAPLNRDYAISENTASGRIKWVYCDKEN